MSVHDIIDALLAAAVVTAWIKNGRPVIGWAVGGLIMTHLVGRHIMAVFPEPLLPLGVGFTGVAAAFLLSPLLTVYGRVTGTLFAAMGMACFASVMTGHNPAIGQGLGLNVWNGLSLLLHLAAATILAGILRHEHILARNRRGGR